MDERFNIDEGMYLMASAIAATYTGANTATGIAAREAALTLRDKIFFNAPAIGIGVQNMADDLLGGDLGLMVGLWGAAAEMTAAYLHYRDRPTQANHGAWKDSTVRFERTFREQSKVGRGEVTAVAERRMERTITETLQ